MTQLTSKVGSGYPNGQVGNNQLFRTPRERFDTRRIALLAELTAVADVCSALSSDRSHRAALPAPEVLHTLRGMAGHHLNGEVVEAFISMVEVFPVGVHVRFDGGRYHGAYGVVTACSPSAPNRPTVRLLFDTDGSPIPEGVEVNLRTLGDEVQLTAVPEAGMSIEEYARRLALARAA